jgi:fumarate reductase flavoprotein subunit
MTEAKVTRRQFLLGAGIAGAGIAGAGLAGCSSATDPSGTTNTGTAQEGLVYGVGKGRGGAIVVELEAGDSSLASLKVISSQETPNVGETAIQQQLDLVTANQSINIDVVSGATISCMGFKDAVSAALANAGLNPDDFQALVALPAPESGDTSTDIVVIGSGGAGLTAAIKAAMAGKSVILLEKEGLLGGTSNFSIEGYGAVGDKAHVAVGSPSTPESLAATMIDSYPNGKEESFLYFAANNGKELDWLRSIGAEFTVCGSPSSAATSREVGPIGVTIVAALSAEAKKTGVDIRLNTAAQEIIMEGGVVSGVKASSAGGEYTISAKAVVVASGGFAANSDMVVEYRPALQGYSYSCAPGSTGDGHLMAEAAGAELLNMDYIRVNFCYTTDDRGFVYYLGSVLNTGAVFVDPDGKRFVNEQSGYGFGLDIVDHGGSGYAIFDHSIVGGSEDVRHYEKLGLFKTADTLEALFDQLDINNSNALDTIETYKGYVAQGSDPDFNRPMLNMTFDEPPFYACPMACRCQGTFGGISTDVGAQALDASGAAIPGLYAVGECANDGTWGANPCSVNIVFGTAAAENAAAYIG